MFALASFSNLVCFQVRLEPTRVNYLSGAPLKEKLLLVLATNIRLGWKGLPVTITQAYNKNSWITAVLLDRPLESLVMFLAEENIGAVTFRQLDMKMEGVIFGQIIFWIFGKRKAIAKTHIPVNSGNHIVLVIAIENLLENQMSKKRRLYIWFSMEKTYGAVFTTLYFLRN